MTQSSTNNVYMPFTPKGEASFNTVGLFTYLRTYARRKDDSDPNSLIESWEECLTRVVLATNNQLNVGFTNEEQQELFDLLYNLKCSVAGRFLWQLGTRTVDTNGLLSLQNCSSITIDEPIEPFKWAMNFLMLGAGVGFRVLPEDVAKLPIVKNALITRKDTHDANHIVPDSREGWIGLLGKVLKAHFYSGKSFSYSCVLLRSKGAPIKGFGGLASGPEVLCEGMSKISDILNKRVGKQVRPIDALDIMNIIGMIVVSGNVRRSALLALGDCKDEEYLRAKRWDLGNVPNYRAYSNNSVVCNDIEEVLNNDEFWQGYEGNGEPYGLINLDLMRSCGRLGETQYPDPNVACVNPCCFHEDTLIAVADGRNAVTIKQLADEDKDVPVYSMNPVTGEIEIKWGRAPRVSGHNQKLLRIVLDNDSFIDVTPFHKFYTMDGREVRADELIQGDSLPKFDSDLQNKEELFIKILHRTFDTDTGVTIICEECNNKFEVSNNNRGTSYCCIECTNSANNKKIECWKSLNKTLYNHRVKSIIELDGEHTVYNMTIEDNHTMSIITHIEKDENGNIIKYTGVQAKNSEQTLESGESCCLAELYLPNISTRDELFLCAKYLYRICKHSLTLPCADSKKTEEIVHRNMRMGLGVTGYLQATEEQRSWLSPCYEMLREFDNEYSVSKGFPKSIKLCTVKPSGCSRGDMLVQTSKGLLRLDELGNIAGEEWQEMSNIQAITDQDDETKNITKFYINGLVDTRKIITSDGLELESSLNHRYRVLNMEQEYVWKTVESLVVGDRLVTKLGGHPENIVTPLKTIVQVNVTNTIHMDQPSLLTRDIAWFLGLFYGDGSVHKKGIRISFNRKQPELIRWLLNFFPETFGLTPVIDDDHSLYVNSQEFLRWLKTNDCLKSFSHDIEIPFIIRSSSQENVLAFIDGFWRADGGIHNPENSWSVCTVSRTFSQQFMVLCRSIGINVNISCAGPGGLGSKDRWIINVRHLKPDKMRYVSKELRDRIWNGFWLDPITFLEDSQCNTYDIEVSDVHHYKLGGVISHNTLSLLAGVTSGVHPGFARYYIRRVRIASESPLVTLAKKNGYPVEFVRNFDGTNNHDTMVISFPYSLPEGTILANECTAVQQLEFAKRLQTEWSDNSISITCYYRRGELDSIKEWLRNNYNHSVKSVSFLLHSDHGFDQAPLEEITKEVHDEMVRVSKPIKSTEGICYVEKDEEYIGEGECDGNHCPIK